MKLQVGVNAFLKNKEKKYLILKRSNKYPEYARGWDIPGGRIIAGVSLKEMSKLQALSTFVSEILELNLI